MALLKPELALPSNTRAWLKSLESELQESFKSDVKTLMDIPAHLLSLGGKRIRPALTFMMAELFNHEQATAELLDIAAGVELIHMATLLHDDIIDEAPTRRGQQSALSKYGLSATLLAGNFLFVRAFGRCARLPNFIIKQTEETCVALTEGELLEENGDFSTKNSLIIGERKTGSLFGLAALSGTFVGTHSEELSLIARTFGNALGVAFQISDDILDVTSTADVLGKEPGTDIKEKKPSLVNTLWLESGSTLSKILISSAEPSPSEIQSALSELKSSRILDLARAEGSKQIDLAKNSLKLLSQSRATNDSILAKLFGLCDFALHRLK
jgi:geranylgeranyl pyrophosphate synthase